MKVPYPMVAAVDKYKRHAQMAIALHRGYPRLEQMPIRDDRSLTIACYGPSLAQTWQTLQRPILSMSGATRWLADRGVIVDYHLDMDPRAHKVKFLDPPVPGVHYLMATVCHPDTWTLLEGQHVTVWHTYSSQETYPLVESLDPGSLVIRGGSTIGLTALHIGGVMGYRHFEIHGMDGSFNDDSRSSRHAGPHYGTKQQDGITWAAGGKTYQTSRIMANAVTETLDSMASPMFCVFHGDGLTQALIRERNLPNACCADEVEKADRVRRASAHILDPIAMKSEPLPGSDGWDRLCAPVDDATRAELDALRTANEPRRAHAEYNTGSIVFEQMVQLRGLCLRQQPKTIIEIGTFIGNSTLAMQADRIYTCDNRNDCLPATDRIVTFPKTQSTAMLSMLVKDGVKADLFFFDGRIPLPPAPDLALIAQLAHDRTLFVVDDYTDCAKGVINARALATQFPHLALVEPDQRLHGRSTLAALVPRSLVA